MIQHQREQTPDGGNQVPPTLSHRSVPARVRWLVAWMIACGPLFVGIMALVTPTLDLHNVSEESHPFQERAHVIGWLAVGVLASLGMLRQRSYRGLLLLWWIGATALVLGLRELDLQVLVNTDNIHHLGINPEWAIHWRTRWLIDPEVPFVVKASWSLLLIVLFTNVFIPFGLARYPWPTALLKRDLFAWTAVGGFGMLALGFVIDGYMEDRFVAMGWHHTLIEESIETLGVLLIVAWTAWLAFGRPKLHIAEP